MQNKKFLTLFLVSVAFGCMPKLGTAQTEPPAIPTVVPAPTVTSDLPKPTAMPDIIPPTKADAPLSDADIKAENKRRLEETLKVPNVAGKSIVDFPNRPSLGSLELAPLPGIVETPLDGPLPMAPSVSGKDMPNEQLLGRITPEVFQEMADLERGNTFLKLQLEKEKLKNDLEDLKAVYRQDRLDEIAKREDVVRSRIQWWQEQENLRLEIEKKKMEEEELARKIAEQEAVREQARTEAMNRLKNPTVPAAETPSDAPVVETDYTAPLIDELYTIISIKGVGDNLSVRLKSKDGSEELLVKKDDILPSGHVVREIKKDTVTVAFGSRVDQLIFRPTFAQ